MCDVNLTFYNDPEDGITEETVRILAARDAPEEAWTWDGIWRLVFPGDLEVPDPGTLRVSTPLEYEAYQSTDFQPVAELVEVEQAFDDGQELLKESLREKLKLLVPGAIDDDYLSFLTGQVELVFETHRVNVMKQSLARSCATVSGQLPDTRSVEPSRKPNRRSRRSTLLHTLQRSAPDSTGGLASRRNSRTSGIKQHTANRLSNEPFRLRNMEPSQTTNNFLTQPDRRQPFPEYWIHANPGTTYTTEPLTTPTNTRDSRDSGIGMTCETCGADSCSCSETASSSSCTDDEASDDEFAAHGKQHPEHQQRPQPKYQISERRHPPRQPRLSVDTNVAADMHLLNPRHFSAAERGGRGSQDWEGARSADITGGRFSPASFKQRVLRQQLGPVGV